MLRKRFILSTALMLLFVSGTAMAQNRRGGRANCPNPGQNCPRSGQGICRGRANAGAGPAAMGRGRMMGRGTAQTPPNPR